MCNKNEPPKDHPKRNRIFQVERVHETIITYDVWAADEEDAVNAVNHEDWHSKKEGCIEISDIQDDEITELEQGDYKKGVCSFLKQCPNNEAAKCAMDEPCEGCKDYKEAYNKKTDYF